MPHTTPSAVPPAVPTTALRSLTVSRMGLGCMGMTMAYGRKDPQEGIAAIRHALDRGVTLLDTADMYANGRNETLVGKAVAGQRDEAVIASKCGILTAPVLGLPRGWTAGRSTSAVRPRTRCAVWGWRRSTCTTCTAWILASPWRTQWAPSASWSSGDWSARSG